MDALLEFFSIDKYSSHNGTQPKYLVDLLPEVCSRATAGHVREALLRRSSGDDELKATLRRMGRHGACYVPRVHAIFVQRYDLAGVSEAVARFVHAACRAEAPAPGAAEDVFYAQVLECALAYLGSRVLCPARAPVREAGLYPLYAQPREAVEEQALYSYRDYLQMLDFLVLHKDFESNQRRYSAPPPLLREGMELTGERLDFVTTWLGQMLGTELYDAYVTGRLSRRLLRSLFFRRLREPAAARNLYFDIARRVRAPRRQRLAA